MFNYDILENTELGIQKIGIKSFYNTDGLHKASDWVREPLKGLKTFDCPQMTSALKIRKKKGRGSVTKNHIGYFLSNANSIQSNGTNVALFSTGIYKGNGFSITPENFERVVTLFAARKLVNGNWLNEKDEYLKPNTEHENWKQFYYDSIIYSLFNNGSEQSSLSNIEYDGRIWQIPNNFFWISVEDVKKLTDINLNQSIQNLRTQENRFVYQLLFGENKIYEKLSENAKEVLDCATNLFYQSFGERDEFSSYENQLYNWDAGYSQLKLLWKEKNSEEFKNFRIKYKELEDKMRPLVYELGFLKK